MSATNHSAAQVAMEKLKELHGGELHMTHTPTPRDQAGLRRLDVNHTSDPSFPTKNSYLP